ncbi:MAG: ABC transporter ATP-binding protein [Alphaproteobacteria bacterium]|nr:ABC transporter ATP-binding protein [Alphaproteobacteria bacterium]
MSIELRNVTKKVRMGHIKLTYTGLDLAIPDGARVALLGRKEAGLDAIVNLICAADAPDKGTITRTQSISWPIPGAGFLSKHLTLAANARFIARLYETNEEAFLARVAETGRFGDLINARMDECPTEMRSLFCFLIGALLPFDHYIFTGLNAGPKEDRGRIAELVGELAQRAGIVLVGQDAKNAEVLCDRAYVFNEGTATYYDDMEAAIEHFSSIEAREVDEDDFMGADPELEDLVNMDF